jgi:hypothetical protein
MLKYIQEFDLLDFCNLVSDVHNLISFSILHVPASCEGFIETQSCVTLWSLEKEKKLPKMLVFLRSRHRKRVRYFNQYGKRYCLQKHSKYYLIYYCNVQGGSLPVNPRRLVPEIKLDSHEMLQNVHCADLITGTAPI